MSRQEVKINRQTGHNRDNRHREKRLPLGPAVLLFSSKILAMIALIFAVMGSAIGVVYCRHLDRRLHIDLQKLQQSRDALHVEWSRLLLEQGTLASDVRVEQVAREQLDMIIPRTEEIWVMQP